MPALGGLSELGPECAERPELDVDAGAIGQDPEAVKTVIAARGNTLSLSPACLPNAMSSSATSTASPLEIELRSLDCDPVTF